MSSLGEAVVEVGADTTGFQQDTERGVNKGLASAAKSAKNLGAGFQSAGRKATVGLTVPIIGIGLAAVKTAGQFESTMAVLQANTGASAKEMAALQVQAKKLGADTVFSANEAADAMLELAKGGFTPAQIEGGGVAATMALAATESMNLADAATIVSNNMNAFGIKAANASKIADALAAGSSASTASVTSLAEGLSNVGGTARNFGLDLNDTVGVLAAFDQNAIRGAEGGTAFNSLLTALSKPTKAAQGALDKYGISLANSDGSFKSITNIAGQFQDKLGGLSDVEKARVATTIAGTYGQKSLNALIKEGSSGIGKYIKATKEQGAAQKLADARMSGTQGAIERMKGSLETASLSIGQALAPTITQVANVIGVLADKFTALSPQTQKFVLIGGAIAAALGPVLIIVGTLISSIGAIAGVFAGLTLAAAAPVAVAVALGAAFVMLMVKSKAARKVVSDAFNQIKAAVMPAVTEISGMIKGTLIPAFIQASPYIEKIGVILLKVFAGAVVGAIKGFVNVVVGVFKVITGLVKVFQGVFTGDWSKAWEGVKLILSGALQAIWGAINVWLNVSVLGLFRKGFALLSGIVRGAWTGIRTIFSQGIGFLSTVVNAGFNLLLLPFKLWFAAGRAILTTAWSVIRTVFSAGIGFVRAVFSRGLGALGGIARGAMNAVRGAFSSVLNGLKSLASSAISGVRGTFSSGLGALRGIASSAIGKVKSAFTTGVTNAVSVIKGLPGKAKSALSGAASTLKSSGIAIIQGFINGIVEKGKDVGGAVKGVLKKARNMLPFSPAKEGPFSGKGWTLYSGRSLMTGLADGISSASNTVVSSTRKVTTALARSIVTGLDKAVGQGSSNVKENLNKLNEYLRKNGERGASKLVSSFGKRILPLSKSLDAVTEKLSAATDTWNAELQKFGDMRDSLRARLSDTSNIGQLKSFKAIEKSLSKQLADTQAYADALQQLANMGLNQASYTQFAADGTDSLAAAQALIKSGQVGIAQVNALQGQIDAYALQAGNTAAHYLYDAGIASAKGVVDGLKKQQDALNASMDRLGARLANAIASAVNDTKLGLKTDGDKTVVVRPKKKKRKATPKRKHAAGTLATLGGSFLAGETGPELVRAPAGSRVYNAKETANLAAGSGSSGPVELSDESIARLAQAILAGAKVVSTRTTQDTLLDTATRF